MILERISTGTPDLDSLIDLYTNLKIALAVFSSPYNILVFPLSLLLYWIVN